jgi:hypothetical protein
MTHSYRWVCGQLLLGVLLAHAAFAQTAVSSGNRLVIPAPTEVIPQSRDFTVSLRTSGGDWRTAPVYLTEVAQSVGTRNIQAQTSVASFDFSGSVDVRITANKESIRKQRIRPLSYGIKPAVTGNTLSFSLSQPRNLSIEINGDIFHNLQLFANAPQPAPPANPSPNVLLYGPGTHKIGTLTIPSGKTIYLASGAVILGNFTISKAQDIRIQGPGIILDKKNAAFSIESSKNILIDGPLLLTAGAVRIGNSDRITIRNIKSFSACPYGDGIDIFCSSHILLQGLFMRNSDDCVAIYGHRGHYYGDVSKITVKDSTFWADVAHPLFIGTHGDPQHPDTLSDLRFLNIDILDQCEPQIDYQGCMSINAGDANLVRNVCFENIRVEDFRQGQLINLRVMFNQKYNTAPGGGIENVLFKDIAYNGTHADLSMIAGYDDAHAIRHISFENLQINGLLISDSMKEKPGYFRTSDMARFMVGEHVQDITFRSSKTPKAATSK